MSSDEPMLDVADQVRQTLMTLSQAVRQMTPSGAKPIPTNPARFNLLARPVHNGCRVCGLPGHQSANVKQAATCRTALLSLIGFWEDVAGHISFLYGHSDRFQKAIQASKPTYEMRLDNGTLRGGDMEVVLVDGLTKSFLKFLSHVRGIRAKANVILGEQEVARYERAVKTVEGFLLNGLTLSDLYERNVAVQK